MSDSDPGKERDNLVQALLLEVAKLLKAKGDAVLLQVEQPNEHEVALIFRLPAEKQRWYVLSHSLLLAGGNLLRLSNQMRLKEVNGRKQLAVAGCISLMLTPEVDALDLLKRLLSWASAAPTPSRPLLKKIPIDPKDLEAFKPDPVTGKGAYESFNGASFIQARQQMAASGKTA
jgi:hypothetical protein